MKENALIIGLLFLCCSVSLAGGGEKAFAPRFPGGQEALMNFITEQIEYPLSARIEGVEGDVKVYLKLDDEGKVSNYQIHCLMGNAFKKEVKKMIRKMLRWHISDHRDAKKSVLITISFKLDEPHL